MFGHRRISTEGGKLKVMGMDIKRSDTSEFVQDFLEECLDATLEGKSENEVIEMIKESQSRL